MVRITDEHHILNPPDELRLRLSKLCYISVLANKLELCDLANQAKDIYIELSNQWDAFAKNEAKKQTSSWFFRVIGGYTTCSYFSANRWNEDWESFSTIIAKVSDKSKIEKSLKQFLEDINNN